MLVGKASRLLDRPLEAKARLAQAIINARTKPRVILVVIMFREAGEHPREALDRRPARLHVEANPSGAVRVLGLFVEQTAKAGEHEGRFAAAGTADDGDEPSILNQPIEGEYVTLAAKKERAVGKGKGPQARERSTCGEHAVAGLRSFRPR